MSFCGVMMTHYPDHPLAGIFPMMNAVELAVLADDIEENGQQEPCWLLDGMTLDGRNRRDACKLKGIEPRYEQYIGGNPLAFVISKNLKRRHLNESQRAMVAARIVREKQGFSPTNNADPANLRDGISQPKAADLLNVSERSVHSAGKILSGGSEELVKAVDAGKATVSAAATVADLPKKEQREAVKAGTVAAKAKEVREGPPRCATCTRKGMHRDDCPECNDLRKEKRKAKPSKNGKPPAIMVNPDADDSPEALWAGHPFEKLLNKISDVTRSMTAAVRQVMPNGEVTGSALKLRAYLQANALLDYKPDAKETVKPPKFILLMGVSKLVELAGQVGPAITDERAKKIYAEACEGSPFIPFIHKKRRDAKKGAKR